MSPEQARGEPLDGRSDLFSLGSVLYAMCAGRPPFRAETAFGVLQRISEPLPTPIRQIVPETPEWLCEIIAKLHAKQPGERFQSAGEVAELLGRWLAHLQQPTVIPAPPRTGDRRRRAKRLRRIAMAAVGVGIVAVGLMMESDLPSPDQPSVGVRRGAEGEGEHRLPSPSGRGAGGEGGEPASPEYLASDATGPHPNPLPAGEGTSVQPLADERALYEGYQDMHQQISQIEREWSQSSTFNSATDLESAAAELHRQADDLGRQIDQDMP